MEREVHTTMVLKGVLKVFLADFYKNKNIPTEIYICKITSTMIRNTSKFAPILTHTMRVLGVVLNNSNSILDCVMVVEFTGFVL